MLCANWPTNCLIESYKDENYKLVLRALSEPCGLKGMFRSSILKTLRAIFCGFVFVHTFDCRRG